MQNLLKKNNENFAADIQLLWSIESGLVYTLPKLIEKAIDLNLARALIHYFSEVQKHRSSIEAICTSMDIDPNGQRSETMESIIAEMITTFAACDHDTDVDDLIIASAKEIGQHEITEYQNALEASEHLGLMAVHESLLSTLNEYKQSSHKLQSISKTLHTIHPRSVEVIEA